MTAYNLYLGSVTSSTLTSPSTLAEVLEALGKEVAEPGAPSTTKHTEDAIKGHIVEGKLSQLTAEWKALKTALEGGAKVEAATLHLYVENKGAKGIVIRCGTVSPALSFEPELVSNSGGYTWYPESLAEGSARELTLAKLEALVLFIESKNTKGWLGAGIYLSVETEAGTKKESTTCSDTITVSSTAVVAGARSRTISDSVSVSDSGTRGAQALARTAADTVVVSDQASRGAQAVARTASDTIVENDQASSASSRSRTVSDTVSINDSVARNGQTLAREAADAVTVSDQAPRTGTFQRTVSDTIGVSDTTSRTIAESRTVGDSATISDAARSSSAMGRTVGDSISTSSTALGVVGFTRSVSDSFSLSDTAQAVISERVEPEIVIVTVQSRSPIVWTVRFAGVSVTIQKREPVSVTWVG